MAARFVLSVDKDGAPVLRAVPDGLAMELPVRMSRSFQASELVEGLIQVGFYHEDQVLAIGGELIGTTGGSTTRDGVTASFEAGAFASPTLVRVQGDPSTSWDALWPKLKDSGRVAASFNVDLAGMLQKGLSLSVADLGTVPAGIAPLLVQRRNVADQRMLVAVGAMTSKDGAWKLTLPGESNPILDGGSFAVLVPSKAWSWVTGTVSMPPGLATTIQQALRSSLPGRAGADTEEMQSTPKNAKITKKNHSGGDFNSAFFVVKNTSFSSTFPSGDVAVKDALVSGNLLQAASGATGLFALPVLAPTSGKLNVKGQRWDLGLTGAMNVDVPSTSNSLRLATIPFAILAVLPQEHAVVDLSAVFTVLTTTPLDPSAITNVKLFRKQGTDPNSTLVETTVRRNLSLDGRTLLITPDQSLVPGANYVLVVDALKSLAGELAPKLERNVSTAAPPPPPAEAEFTRITLGYPDDSFNVPLTIPAGAIPAGASLLLEGQGMGYTYSGTMPNGDLKLTIRAALGERLKITVQIGGRSSVGYVSRYAAGDGRVTVGVDGGRVEASDGSGAAVTFPLGSLAEPVELRVSMPSGLPEDLDPELAKQGTIAARIRVEANHVVELKARPIFEFPAPTKPSTQAHSDGLGPYALFDRVEGFEEDSSPCVYFQLSDTAALSGGKLVSKGGLPGDPTGPAALAGRFGAAAPSGSMAEPSPHAGPRPMVAGFAGGLLGMFMESFLIDSGPHYVSGFVTIQQPGQTERPDEGAFVYFAKSSKALKRAGQMLQRTGHTGSYILASFLTDELVRGGGEVMAVDKDWGVRGFSGTGWGGPGGIYGTYYHAPTIHLAVTPTDLGDRVAPWVEMEFSGDGVLAMDTLSPAKAANLVVRAKDNRTANRLLKAGALLDGQKMDTFTLVSNGSCPGNLCPVTTTPAVAKNMAQWTVALPPLSEGTHRLEILVSDEAGNLARLVKEFAVVDLSSNGPSIPNAAPVPSLDMAGTFVGGMLKEVSSKAVVKVRFSEPVTGVSSTSVVLERNEADAWVIETARLVGPGGDIRITDGVQGLCFRTGTLQTGAEYRVRFSVSVVDSEKKSIVPLELHFRTESTQGLGTLDPQVPLGKLTALGARIFAQGWDGSQGNQDHLVEFQISDKGLTRMWRFGPHGASADAAFHAQIINEIKAVQDISLDASGTSRSNLLLVTTSPKPGDNMHQAVLWAFQCCEGGKAPELLFAMSLGQGSAGYAPSVDARNGLIVVGRLSSSVLLVDAAKALSGWALNPLTGAPCTPLDVISSAGANQGAILQPFYVTNPEGTYAPSHPGVALMGADQNSGPGAIRVAVGDPSGPVRGLPSMTFIYSSGGIYRPQAPFLPSASDPEVDARATKRPLPDGEAGLRVAAIPELVINDGATPRTASLALAMTSLGQHLAVVDETDPGTPKADPTWVWPKAMLFQPKGHSILRRTPVVDRFDPTKVLVTVQNIWDSSLHFYVLDIGTPGDIKSVAHLQAPKGSAWATLEYGIVHMTSSAGISSTWCYSPKAAARGWGVRPGPAVMVSSTSAAQPVNWEELRALLFCQVYTSDLRITYARPDQGATAYRSYSKKKQGNTSVTKLEIVSVPAEGLNWGEKFNTEIYRSKVIAPYFLLDILRKQSITVSGLDIRLEMDVPQSSLAVDPWNSKIYESHPVDLSSNNDPTFRKINSTSVVMDGASWARDTYRVRPTFRRTNRGVEGIDAGWRDWPPKTLTYRIKVAGASQPMTFVRSPEEKLYSFGYAVSGEVWPLWSWPVPASIGTYSTADAGGDKWCAPGVYRFLYAFQNEALADPDTPANEKTTDGYNRNMLVNIGDISGEHGRDLGHGSHRWGTDIDFIWPQPIPGNTSGSGNFDTMRIWIQNKDTVHLTKWVRMARERLERLLKHPRVKLIYFTQTEDSDINQGRASGLAAPCQAVWDLLRKGKINGIDLGIGKWNQERGETWQNKLKQQKSHWNHFHVAFEEMDVNTFPNGPGDLNLY